MQRVELTGLSYSPWTERARWALDHHGISYRYTEHVPLLGEPLLRWKARRAGDGRRASVPLLRAGDAILMDSMEIIEWADRHGQGASLKSDSKLVRSWAMDVESGLSSIRSRVIQGVLTDRAAQIASARAAVPGALAALFAPVAVQGARFVVRKHEVALTDGDVLRTTCRSLAERMRTQLGGAEYADGDRFSALDLLFVSFLQGIRPVGAPWLPLDPAVARVWTDDGLASEFSDLLDWRDRLYRAHRQR